MRAFFGIPLDDKLRAALMDVQNDLRGAGADVTWPAPDSLHMTMKFLGQVDDGLRFNLPPMRALDLDLVGIGEFAGRIVWAGCRGNLDGLCAIAARLEEAAERVGVPREKRPFEPHVTIGRIRSTRNLGGLRKAMDKWKDKVFGPWRVRKIQLFKSETSPRGAVYKVVAEFPCTAT
jgi:2'-5' RNA ligase